VGGVTVEEGDHNSHAVLARLPLRSAMDEYQSRRAAVALACDRIRCHVPPHTARFSSLEAAVNLAHLVVHDSESSVAAVVKAAVRVVGAAAGHMSSGECPACHCTQRLGAWMQ